MDAINNRMPGNISHRITRPSISTGEKAGSIPTESLDKAASADSVEIQKKPSALKKSKSTKTRQKPDASLKLPQKKKEWTVLLYMAGDNELEPFLVGNVMDLEKTGSDYKVNLVAELDRGDTPSPLSGGWKGARRLFIEKSSDNQNIASPVLQDLGDVNMSDPKHLADFIEWGMENFPAKHYCLIINDHGYGFMGAVQDKGNNDIMTLEEMGGAFSERKENLKYIKSGIKTAEKETGKKLDIIGFDACLMGQAEVAFELKDAAKILVASQEVIGGTGWPYHDFLKKGRELLVKKGPVPIPPEMLKTPVDPSEIASDYNKAVSDFFGEVKKVISEKGEISAEDVARGIINTCKNHTSDIPTMSAILLGEPIENLADAAAKLAKAIISSNKKGEILRQIKLTQSFSRVSPDLKPYSDYRDVFDFCEKLKNAENIKDVKVKKAAEGLQSAANAAILDRIDDKHLASDYKKSYGISMYIPDTKGQGDFGYGKTRFEKKTHWLESIEQVAEDNPSAKVHTDLKKPPPLQE